MTQAICVWYWFIFLPYVCPFFEKIMLDDILLTLNTKHYVIKAERAQTKSGNGTIGYRRKLPSVEITLPRDMGTNLIIHMFSNCSIIDGMPVSCRDRRASDASNRCRIVTGLDLCFRFLLILLTCQERFYTHVDR